MDVQALISVINDYLRLDEVERALWLLDNLPGRYRDFPPPELTKLREDILGAIVTPHAYQSCELDADIKPDSMNVEILTSMLRGMLILEEVKRFNELRLVPHLVDVGPGEYFVPLGLQALDCKFTYWDVAMDRRTGAVAHPRLERVRTNKFASQSPIIFLALEIIEHLPEPRDLLVEALRHCGRMPERIHLSTPLYCYDTNQKDWNKPCGLPHLRTYTPVEFIETARKLFREYLWEFYESPCMSLRGCNQDRPDSVLLSQCQFKQMGTTP